MRKLGKFRALFIPLLLWACSDSGDNSPEGSANPDLPGGEPSSGDEPRPADSPPADPLPEGVFESAHPSGGVEGTGRGESVGATGSVSGGGVAVGDDAVAPAGNPAPPMSSPAPGQAADPNAPGPTSPPSAERAIEEADIIKRSGDRLYALSAHGGLSVIDISDPDDLKLLGRHQSVATPFEMYVRGESVFVLYNGYGEYTYDEASQNWTFYQTSYVMALDTSDPTSISEQERFEVEGYISDSRLIGDVLYVVAFDDSYCYRCGSTPETNVLSLHVGDPREIAKVDELTIEEKLDSYSWQRSLSATDERLYIAGPRYGSGSEPAGSIIQVVDIADASGELIEGDSVEVAGQINSRWQMDEYEGVLRVISQPLQWRSGSVPQVETFSIVSSQELEALGKTDLVLPRPETLQSVRFDGPRGYAITFELTDPLFTIDLSDPENPMQMGELEIPGWVYHMEPRGDRVIGLGFDQGNSEGSLTVSLFDVSDFSAPTMIDRVNFGGDWAQFAEDQNRIHKSFQVLDDHELVLVPFSGHTYDDNDECRRSRYVSGVQLIDWAEDELALRGVAPSQGQARRAFIHDDRLVTMSNERLESFDIADRDEPESTSALELAQIVNQIATVDETVVRIGSDWWTGAMQATVSSLDDLLAYERGVQVEIPNINQYTCNSESWLQEIFSSGERVYFMYHHYGWDENAGGKEATNILTLDVSDPEEPKVAGDAALGFRANYGRSIVPGMVNNGRPAIAAGEALVFARHDIEYNQLGFVTRQGYTLEVVDLSDPKEPELTSVEMPDSLGSTGLLESGSVVASSHFAVSPTNPNAVRFYLDRLDVSNPAKPKLMDPVNIPGSVLAYDHASERALTIDYQYVTIEDISPKQCHEEEFGQFLTDDPSRVSYENARGPCSALRFTLYLVQIEEDQAAVVGSYEVDKGVYITAAAIGEDRVFLGTGLNQRYGVAVSEPAIGGIAVPPPGPVGGSARVPYYTQNFQAADAKLLVASGLSEDELTVSSVTLETTQNFYGFNGLVASGKKAVVATGFNGELSVIDASDADEPVVRDSVALAGRVQDLDLAGDVAIAALGQSGVQTIRLESKGDD